MILLLSITLPIILLLYILYKTKHQAKTTLPPGPPPLPLIGNLHQLAGAADPHIYLHQVSRKYGPIIHMKLGSTPLVVISSSKLAKQVLKIQDSSFCSRPKLLVQQKLSYNSSDLVFTPYNERWREMKKVTHIHLLNPKKVQSFRPLREEEISRMITKIRSSCSDNRAVNLSEATMAAASRLASAICFGKRYEEGGSEARRYGRIVRGFDALMTAFFVSDYFPALSWVDKISGKMRDADRMCKDMDSFYQELIDERLDSRARVEVEEEEKEKDMLSVLIKLIEDKSSSTHLTWDNIKALLMDMISASSETIPASTIWTMTALIKAPKVMKKLQNEIRSLVGEKGKVDEDDLPKLPYLKAVINETFRMYPPGPLLVPRESMETSILDGYEIAPKTRVYVNAYAVGRDPEYWKNPDEFIPERFLNSNIDFKGQDFGLIPFGSGRRMCPGMNMGHLSMELMVANLLYCFDWELPKGIHVEDVDTNPTHGPVVHKKNALLLVPKIYGF
ncbi:6,7,8-trihydroxycoumarin synthase-like [Salvia miltiorrhiza]|uniref:6,7,8-trihydroxycoumarin synthase-like n=1 Tax=Salvia miltiorrhiza TaxID=226208 RepID=UPI0025ABB8B3|nr:6,7,8-trihydroxycoumarin synthase-like [Salvia miltiorrhiza]